MNFMIKAEYIIGDNSIDVLFECDPERNTECSKLCCGEECTRTTKMQYAKRYDVEELK